MQKINKLALSLALSIISGIVVLIFSVWHVIDGFAAAFIKLFVSCHPTVFTSSEAVGFILVNTGYAAIDGFIIGYLLAVLYNQLLDKFEKGAEKKARSSDQSES